MTSCNSTTGDQEFTAMKSPTRWTMKSYPRRLKLILTACNFYIFVNLGIISVMPTVALIDLAYLMDSSFTELSYGLTLNAIAALIGSLLCKFHSLIVHSLTHSISSRRWTVVQGGRSKGLLDRSNGHLFTHVHCDSLLEECSSLHVGHGHRGPRCGRY